MQSGDLSRDESPLFFCDFSYLYLYRFAADLGMRVQISHGLIPQSNPEYQKVPTPANQTCKRPEQKPFGEDSANQCDHSEASGHEKCKHIKIAFIEAIYFGDGLGQKQKEK